MALTPEERNNTFQKVADGALLRNARREDEFTVEGEITVEGLDARLRLVLDESFPTSLPTLYLCPWDALGFLPHVLPVGRRLPSTATGAEPAVREASGAGLGTVGLVCYKQTEGILVDRRRPLAIVQEALESVRKTLEDGVTGRNRSDFVDEFDTYWLLLKDVETVWSVLEPAAEPSKVMTATASSNFRYLCRDIADLEAFLNCSAGAKYTHHRAFYVPLEPGTLVVPPRHDQPFWNAESFREMVWGNVSKATARWLKKAIRGRVRQSETVILSLMRPSGGAIEFGVRFVGVEDQHPLLDGGKVERLCPVHCVRADRTFVLPRGGAEAALGQKHVLLVGCGALGGHVAYECAKAGVLNLTLVDREVLEVENTFRHVLGRRYWKDNKAEALKKEIEAELPYTKVRAVPKKIEDALGDESVEFTQFDLVIFALARPTLELELNERIQNLKGSPPTIFTWLEPYGIGGHALATRIGKTAGCFECLYADTGGEAGLGNRAAFAAPGQHFGKALSGCGSLFTPYGSIDAIRTAALAVQLAVDVLEGKENRNALVSWKGDTRDFREEGFVTSERFEYSQERLLQDRYKFPALNCIVCGGIGAD